LLSQYCLQLSSSFWFFFEALLADLAHFTSIASSSLSLLQTIINHARQVDIP